MPGTPATPLAYPRASCAQVHGVAPHKTARRAPWAVLYATIGMAMAVLAVVTRLVMVRGAADCGLRCPQPPPPRPVAPLQPAVRPLRSPLEYTSGALGFTVDYPSWAPPSAQDAQSVSWEGQLKTDNSEYFIKVQAEAANGRTSQQLVRALQQNVMNGATLVFTIGGAELGYDGGSGNVYDGTLSPQGGQQVHERAIIEAAIRDGVAVELVAMSNYKPDANDHPSPASLEPFVEGFADLEGNTVTWKDEQPL